MKIRYYVPKGQRKFKGSFIIFCSQRYSHSSKLQTLKYVEKIDKWCLPTRNMQYSGFITITGSFKAIVRKTHKWKRIGKVMFEIFDAKCRPFAIITI